MSEKLNTTLLLSIQSVVNKEKSPIDIKKIQKIIQDKHAEVIPEPVIKQCIEDYMIPYYDVVRMEEEDRMLIYKNNVDFTHRVERSDAGQGNS